MTYDRVRWEINKCALCGAVISHSAKLVRGTFVLAASEGPLIWPSATFSPRGEGGPESPCLTMERVPDDTIERVPNDPVRSRSVEGCGITVRLTPRA